MLSTLSEVMSGQYAIYFIAWGGISLFLGYLAGYSAAAKKANKVVYGAYALLNGAERAAFKRALKASRVAHGKEKSSEKAE
jgi:hypothetical protein